MDSSPFQPFNAEEIDLTWTDENIVMLLHGYAPETPLPTNVINDSNPFQCLPHNLPEDVWYLLDADVSKESVYGFWLMRNDPVKIHSNAEMDGWRTTWDYVSSWDDVDVEETQWLMQEYTTTVADGCPRQDEPAARKMLCKIFKSGEQDGGGDQGFGHTPGGSDPQLLFGTVDWQSLLR